MDLANFEAPGTELFCISFVYCFDGKINKDGKRTEQENKDEQRNRC